MQNILSKRTLTVLSWTRTLRFNPMCLSSLYSMSLNPSVSVSLSKSPSFSFANETKFDNAPSFDGIINSISNSENANQILDAFTKAGSHYRNEQIVLSMRMLARLIRTINRNEFISKDERFIKLQERMKEGIDSYSDHELLDLLFWLRKFRMYRIQLGIPDKDVNRIFLRINDFIKSKTYSCRNLINIYFDYCHMNQNTDLVVIEILNDIKLDSKILTTFSCIQIIQAASYKSYMTAKDSILLSQIIRAFPAFEQDFDIEQKSTILKHLSKLELNYSTPRFQLPNLIFRLKDQLKEKIEQLSEMSVTNVIGAYESLPKEFPGDLLEEIKEMICVTLQHNPKNIKSLFLLDIYDSLNNIKLKKRRLSDQKIAIVDKEIFERLKARDPDLIKSRSLERLLEIYNKLYGQKGDEGVAAIYETYCSNSEESTGKYNNYVFLEAFAKHKLDIKKFIDMEIIREKEIKRASTTVRLCSILDFLKIEQYSTVLQELEVKINELIEKEPMTVARTIVNSDFNYPFKAKLYEKLTPEIQKLWLNKTYTYRSYFRTIYETTVNRNIRFLWIEFLRTKVDQLNQEETLRNAILDAISSVQDPNPEAFSLVIAIFSLIKPNGNDLRRLLNILKENKKFISVLDRNDYLIQRLAKLLNEGIKEDSTKLRIVPLYSLALRFNTIRPRNMFLYPALEKMVMGERAYEVIPQIQIALFLLNRKSLSPKTADIVLKKMMTLKAFNDNVSRIRLFNHSALILKEINETDLLTFQKNYALIKENLNNPSSRQVLNNLAIILGFPPQIIKGDIEFLKKTLSDFIQQGTTMTYVTLIRSLVFSYVLKERTLYFPIVKELTNNFNTFSPRMPYSDILDCLTIFTRVQVRNPSIYNLIIENIGKNFNITRLEDFVSILKDFSFIGLKQVDLFDKVLQKLNEKSPSSIRTHFSEVITSLFNIGYDSDWIKKEFINMTTTIGLLNENILKSLIQFLIFLPILELKDEEALFESHINKLVQNIEGNKLPLNIATQAFNNYYFMVLYMKYVYKNKPELAKKLEDAILSKDKDGIEKLKLRSRVNSPNFQKTKALELIESYLKVIKVDSKKDFEIDGLPIDLYIPEQNLIIKIINLKDMNYDKKSLRGPVILMNKIYKSFTQYTFVNINVADFNSNPDHLSKVKYLMELGIKSSVSENEFDFTHLKPIPAQGGKSGGFRKPAPEPEGESDSESVIEEEIQGAKKVEAVLEDVKDLDDIEHSK